MVDPVHVVQLLTMRGQTVGTAESLTGGLVCAALTSVPGASAVVRGAVVAYAADVKAGVLGVPVDVIAEHGVVSSECAVAMAQGARRVLGSDWAAATTGVAGPEPCEGMPVGTVHLAVAGPSERGEHRVQVRALTLHGSRDQIRAATVRQVLDLLGEALAGE